MTIARSFTLGIAALCLAGGSAGAQESQAKSWNLANEQMVVFQGQVVDILCELSGDCPDNCGDGSRQLGILRDDDVLVLAGKNGQPNFAGAVRDLLPYCGKQVDVDGLMTGQEGGHRFFQVQLVREAGQGEWQKANLYTEKWAEAFPEEAGAEGPWFRKDPRVVSRIEESGYLGLGHEADEEFIEEWK